MDHSRVQKCARPYFRLHIVLTSGYEQARTLDWITHMNALAPPDEDEGLL